MTPPKGYRIKAEKKRNSQQIANEKYRKENLKMITLSFYPPDYDLYNHIKKQDNMTGYIKGLVRKDMEESK